MDREKQSIDNKKKRIWDTRVQSELKEWLTAREYEKLIEGTHPRVQEILGNHLLGEGQVLVTYHPNAKRIFVVSRSRKRETELIPIGEEGLFAVYLKKESYKKYFFRVEYNERDILEMEDSYGYPCCISDLDIYLFGESTHYEIYHKLGAHPMKLNGVDGVYFAVWAPHAKSVCVAGNFNLWDGRHHYMRSCGESGIYELFVPGAKVFDVYKYQIMTPEGEIIYKSDPYANCSEYRPGNGSVVTDIRNFQWTDRNWMSKKQKRSREDLLKEPMSVYEMHLGSWKKKPNYTLEGFHNYREMAPMLADYLIDMGYTHVELIGMAEHPFDGSWGYQVTGYYAPTRRFGMAEDFAYFVDYLHGRGIGVILDWVPAHFPKDPHGLKEFDGKPLYEYEDPKKGEHPHWGTLIFDYGKKQVKNFLIANALFWLKEFHIDGLRVDAVASMLYLDYGKGDGEWIPNEYGGRENLEVVEFFRHLNSIVEQMCPGSMMIAEESTAWPKVSHPVQEGGLGFTHKWNMGWMNDFLTYVKMDPYFRKYNHQKLVFSMMYAYSENFVQVLSHDEVVHGKGSMIGKMYGTYDEKFAALRTTYGFMYGHPGKKLLFMGQEFAQEREWSEERELDWGLLTKERHAQMQHFVRRLNHLYQQYSAFYYYDYEPYGFEWMSCDDAERSVVAFVRRGKSKSNQLLFICNFTPVTYEDYAVAVPCRGKYTEILNSNSIEFGGTESMEKRVYKGIAEAKDGKPYQIKLNVAPLSVVVLNYNQVE